MALHHASAGQVDFGGAIASTVGLADGELTPVPAEPNVGLADGAATV